MGGAQNSSGVPLADVDAAAAGKNVISAYEFVSGSNGFGGEGPENLDQLLLKEGKGRRVRRYRHMIVLDEVAEMRILLLADRGL